MRYVTGIVGVVLAALALFTATSAFALVLPDIHVLSGEVYPLHLNVSDNKTTAMNINDTAGNQLEGTGVLLLFLTFELSSLGSFEVLFLKVINRRSHVSCNSLGDPAGEVLVKGSFHIVPLNTSKEDAILYLFKELVAECNGGAEKVKIKGALLAQINFKGVAETGDFTELCISFKGDQKGKNTATKYLDDAGNEAAAKLEANFGAGFLQGALEIPEICPAALGAKMFQVLNR